MPTAAYGRKARFRASVAVNKNGRELSIENHEVSPWTICPQLSHEFYKPGFDISDQHRRANLKYIVSGVISHREIGAVFLKPAVLNCESVCNPVPEIAYLEIAKGAGITGLRERWAQHVGQIGDAWPQAISARLPPHP